MPQKFLFEELDASTRNYLIAVREGQGGGSPGVFAPTSSTLAGCGCVAGLVTIVATLLLTLTNWIGVIYDDPVRVALLQTAGIMLGAWLLMAAIRASFAGQSQGRGPLGLCRSLASVRGEPGAGHHHADRRSG